MIKYIVKRLAISILIVFLISVFAFSLMHILPGDPVKLVLGEEANQADIDALREKLNLNKPLVEQYLLWIKGVFCGDFGESITYSRNVSLLLAERLPRTISIGVPALIISVIFGVLFGVISAIKRGRFLDRVITIISTIGAGTPVFWLGILGIFIFSVELKLLPIQGYVSPSEDVVGYIQHAILPIACMSLGLLTAIARQTRSNMLEVINQDYVRTARANGIYEGKIILSHALKNALIPIITIIALQVRMVIGGSVLVEEVFNIPGVGALLKVAVANRDYLVVQGCVLVISLVTVGCNFIVDVLYGVVNPAIRTERN